MIRIKTKANINTERRRQLLGLGQMTLGLAGFHLGSVLAAASANKSALTSPPKPEKRGITLAITNPSALPYLPILVAQHKGFFAQQGLEVQWSEQQSATRAIAAVASGQADIVCGWLENMLSEPGRALGLQSFAILGIAPMMCLGVPMSTAVRANNQTVPMPTALAALRGRKIGVVALNSPTHTVALAALRRAGLRASDVGFVSVGSASSAATALRSGQIDALVHMDPLMLELEQRGELALLCDMRSPNAAYEALGMHLPSSCVAAPQEFLQRFPGTAQACSDALIQALQWLQQASLRDILLLQRSLPESVQAMEPQTFVASYERLRLAFSSDGICSMKSAQDLLQAMHDAEPALRLEKIDPAKSVTNSLVQRSVARLKN